jgi:hypothetical protein
MGRRVRHRPCRRLRGSDGGDHHDADDQSGERAATRPQWHSRCTHTSDRTIGVIADCELTRGDVEAAEQSSDARGRVATALKRCADDVVAPVPDGRA